MKRTKIVEGYIEKAIDQGGVIETDSMDAPHKNASNVSGGSLANGDDVGPGPLFQGGVIETDITGC